MANGVGHSYSSILSHSIKDICFIGHSLNKADYSYFQSIFDYLSIYDSPVSLNFFYTTFHEKNASVMQDYQHSIQILLDRYGETLDNKSHGDNLTAKLLLENRLNLIRIPVQLPYVLPSFEGFFDAYLNVPQAVELQRTGKNIFLFPHL